MGGGQSAPAQPKVPPEANSKSGSPGLQRTATKAAVDFSPPSKHNKTAVKRRQTQHTLKVEEIHDKDTNELHVNQYTLTELLGQGAYGQVYKTIHRATGVIYACKVMRKSQLKRKRIGRFKNELDNVAREIAVWKKLKNEYVVDCIEVIDDPNSDSIYIISEFMNGSAIRPNSLECEPVDGETLRDWAAMIVAGLNYLHVNGVIHRDLKPANVLLHKFEDGKSVVKLGDFGLSQQHDHGKDSVSNTVGTTAFMAPETFTGEEFSGKRIDIWALGVTLYMLAYGKLPWQVTLYSAAEDIMENDLEFPEYTEITVVSEAPVGDTPATDSSSILELDGSRSPARSSTRKKKAPVDDLLKDLISQLLNKDPDKRPMCPDIIKHPYFTKPRTPRSPGSDGEGGAWVGTSRVAKKKVKKRRPTSAAIAANNIEHVERVMVSEGDIKAAFTHRHISQLRATSLAVVRMKALLRSVTDRGPSTKNSREKPLPRERCKSDTAAQKGGTLHQMDAADEGAEGPQRLE